jgi:hypothetical protein
MNTLKIITSINLVRERERRRDKRERETQREGER